MNSNIKTCWSRDLGCNYFFIQSIYKKIMCSYHFLTFYIQSFICSCKNKPQINALEGVFMLMEYRL